MFSIFKGQNIYWLYDHLFIGQHDFMEREGLTQQSHFIERALIKSGSNLFELADDL